MNLPQINNNNLNNETHVWAVDLDQWKLPCHKAVRMLSECERKKAEHFHFEILRARYIKSHHLLRSLIGMYLGFDFYVEEFHINKHGKPALKSSHTDNTIYFNISNSENICVCAFSQYSEIGIDIEKIHDLPDMDQIMERFFSFDEKIAFLSLPERNRKQAFFQYWARKEALLKSMGMGLSFPMNQVNVHSENNCSSPVMTKNAGIERMISDLNIFDGFAAAIAFDGKHNNYSTRLLYVAFNNEINKNLPMKDLHNSNIFLGAAEPSALA